MPLPTTPPLSGRSSRRMRDLLSGNGEQDSKLTKAQERARRALEMAKTGRRGDIPNPSRIHFSPMGLDRGTSAARIRRRRRLEERCEESEEEELDKRAAEAEIGIASPLPSALIRPIAVKIKKIHGLGGEVSDFKE